MRKRVEENAYSLVRIDGKKFLFALLETTTEENWTSVTTDGKLRLKITASLPQKKRTTNFKYNHFANLLKQVQIAD